MVSTFTTNKAIERPGSGDYVGTWDMPVNSNMTAFDAAFGTIQAISLAGGSVTLSTAQARSPFLNFTGALPSNVTVTIPGLSSSPGTVVSGGFYTIQNLTSNTSVFTVTIATTVAGQQAIGCPPFEPFDILVEGTGSSQAGSVKFRSLGMVGSYWDYGGSSVPAWVTACTKPPYLNCDGTAFSSATYPALATVLGGTTLPDSRGRSRFNLNQGTGRLSSSLSINGDAIFTGGGSQLLHAHTHANSLNDPGHIHSVPLGLGTQVTGAPAVNSVNTGPTNTAAALTGMTITNASAGAGASQNVPPAYIGGLTLIRSA